MDVEDVVMMMAAMIMVARGYVDDDGEVDGAATAMTITLLVDFARVVTVVVASTTTTGAALRPSPEARRRRCC